LPAPSLGIEQADAHNLRGRLLQARDPRGALEEYRQALEIFEKLWQDRAAHYLAPVHQRYEDFLLNLARFGRERQDVAVHMILVRAVSGYLDRGQVSLALDSVADARLVLQNVSNLLPELTERDRTAITKPHRDLQDRLAARK
jgi:hypothetical protein